MSTEIRIPGYLKEEVWKKYAGNRFKRKCWVDWCHYEMTVFDYQVTHNILPRDGGKTELENLRPICVQCKVCIGNTCGVREWSQYGNPSWTGGCLG